MNELKPTISIIIPVYNVEKYLRQCLESLINQTYKEIEIICVNDESPDNSLEILNEYAKSDERIVIVNKKNEGVSAARNAGLKVAKGEYIMFVDSDDWVDLQMCEMMYEAAKKENADSVMCSYVKEFLENSVINHIFPKNIVFNKNEVQEKFHRRLFGLIDEELKKPEDGDVIVSPCMQLFKCDIVKGIEFVSLNEIGTSEDALYQIMVYENCNKLVYMDEPYYHYRKINEVSITSSHKPDLFEKWQNLFSIMNEIIEKKHLGENYNKALNNRIALSMLGLGLNEAFAKNKNIFKKAKRLKQMLKTERYEKAYKDLDFKYFPFQWKVFFYLCKFKMTLLLMLMLQLIEFLRKRAK